MLGELPSEFDPVLQTRTPEHVWNGHWTYGYPFSFDFGFVVLISGHQAIYENLQRYLNLLHLIPEEGNILDLGCGPSSHYIFGEELTQGSVYGVDYSQTQLEKSKIPHDRQIVADLRDAHLPEALKGNNFALMTAFLAVRYLSESEAKRLYANLRPLGERLVVADVYSANHHFEKVLGQQREFEPLQEKALLEEVGYVDVQTREIVIPRSGGAVAAQMVWGNTY
jgi:SAM-dependent methyltransferase